MSMSYNHFNEVRRGTRPAFSGHAPISSLSPEFSGDSTMNSSRYRLFAIVCALALVSTMRTAQGQGRGQSRPEPGTLIIRNVMFDSVRIEVRIGPSNNCEMNPMVGVRKLRKGR